MFCLAVAIGAIAMAVRSTLRAGDIEGPVALVVTPAQEVWLGAERELWRIDADGRLIDRQALGSVGLPGAPSNLVRGPGGSIVATVRGDATLYVLDATTARVMRTLQPRWPADLQRHGGRATNLAFHSDGRFAIATGGGHAVALFDADGALIERTPPGRYEFTNGLWWNDEGSLWTTDTNRFTLRLLDGTTLAERRAVDLGAAPEARFLGPARGKPGGGAALIRYRGDMTEGIVARVAADGTVKALPASRTIEPRDLDWLGDVLLASDGASMSVLRWTAAGAEASPFGDEALQRRFAALGRERDALRKAHVHWLVGAGVALTIGMLFAALAPRLARRGLPAPPKLDLSQLGTPKVGHRALLALNLRASGWVFVLAVPLLLLQFVPAQTLKGSAAAVPPMVLIGGAAVLLLLLLLLPLALMARRMKRLALLPEFEPSFNQRAMLMLRHHPALVASALRPGEQVLETFTPLPGLRWCVLTGERLLCFTGALFGPRLASAHELGDVIAASREPSSLMPPGRWQIRSGGAAWVEIAFASAAPIAGSVSSATLARRVVERINALSAPLRLQRNAQHAGAAAGEAAGAATNAFAARRRRRAIASALVPGLGQWQQRRGGEAIVFASAFAALVIFLSAPMLWTLVEPYAGVTPLYATIVALAHAALGAVAAADAWFGESVAIRR